METRFMKQLRAHLVNKYPVGYAVGAVYSGDGTITFFPFTPMALKEQQLKIAIVFNQQEKRFEIWLAGQNRSIQKKYWELVKRSDCNTYHIPTSIDTGFSIVDTVLVEHPDLDDWEKLTEQIETGAKAFVDEMLRVIKNLHTSQK